MSERLTDDKIEAFFSAGTHWERELACEILDRRARDLTAEDREALLYLRGSAPGVTHANGRITMLGRALSALDKLLGGK